MDMTPKQVENYEEYYTMLRNTGSAWLPRGHGTTALRDLTVTFPRLQVPRRLRDNPAIGIVEGLQLIAGVFDRNSLEAAAPNARLELFSAQSAYGPRVATQIPRIITALIEDNHTRQAVIVIDKGDEPPASRPCTTSIQFQADESEYYLNASVSMRSSDAVWGLPYDLIQFNMLLTAVAVCTRFVPGTVTMHLGNAHIYDNTAVQTPWRDVKFHPNRLVTHGIFWDEQVKNASLLLNRQLSSRELISMFIRELT